MALSRMTLPVCALGAVTRAMRPMGTSCSGGQSGIDEREPDAAVDEAKGFDQAYQSVLPIMTDDGGGHLVGNRLRVHEVIFGEIQQRLFRRRKQVAGPPAF